MITTWPDANGAYIAAGSIFPQSGVLAGPAPPAAVLWEPIFTSNFTGADTDPWPPEWATYGDVGAIEDLLSNQGRLFSPASSTQAYASAILSTLLKNVRVDYDLTIPANGINGRFVHNAELRIIHTTTEPPSAPDSYRVRIQRFNTGDQPNVRIRRILAGAGIDLGTLLTLTNTELQYRVRFQVLGGRISAAVRQFSTGVIPEGDWDRQTINNDVTQAGTLRFIMDLIGASVNNQVLIDNVVISQFVGGSSLIAGAGRRVLT